MSNGKLRKGLKIFAIVLAGTATLLVLLLVALRSPFVLDRILPPIQRVLERDFKLQTKIGKMTIDPLARVALQGVEAQWTDPSVGQVSLQVDSVLVRFSLWQILQRNLQVSSIQVVSPKVKASLNLLDKKEKKPPENPLSMIKNLIVSPPVAMNLDALSVSGLELDVALKRGKSDIRLFAGPLNLNTELHVIPRQVDVALKLSLGRGVWGEVEKGLIRISALNLSPLAPSIAWESPIATEVSAHVGVSFLDEKNPQLKIGRLEVRVDGEKIQLNSRLSQAGQARVEVGQLSLRSAKDSETVLPLAPIFALESVPGQQFVESVPKKVFQSLKSLTFGLSNEVALQRVRAVAKLPASGIDSDVSMSLNVPLTWAVDDSKFKLHSGPGALNFTLKELKLQGKAFAELSKSVKLAQLNGTRFKTPFEMTFLKPSFARMSLPLEGMRLDGLKLEPALHLGNEPRESLKSVVHLQQMKTGEFKCDLKADVSLNEEHRKLVPQLKALHDTVGWLEIKSQLGISMKSGWNDLQKLIDDKKLDLRAVELSYALEMKQTTLPPKNSPTAVFFPGGLQIHGDAKINQPVVLKDVQLRTQVDWDKQPLLFNSLKIENLKSKLLIQGDSKIDALMRLRKLSKLAEPMGMLGGSKIDLLWSVVIPHGAQSILTAALPPPLLVNADVNADATVQLVEKPVTPLFEDNTLLIAGPVKAQISSALRRGVAKVGLTYQLPRVGTEKLAVVERLSGRVDVETRTDLRDGLSAGVQVKISEISPAKKLGLPEEALPYLKNINAAIQLRTDLQTRVDLKSVKADTGSGKLIADLSGGTDMKASNSRFEGELSVRPPPSFKYGIRAQDKLSLDGLVRVAWELTQKEQKSLRLRGRLNLEDFSAQHQLGGLRKANGRIPFQQDLELPNFKSLKWSYLIRDNPFKQVDTSKFVPLTLDDSLVTIAELNALEKKFGPLRARLSVLQNMVTIDKLDADLFDGVLAGQGFIDIQPSRLLAGLQGRITKLNTALLASKPEKFAASPLSARLALIVDLSKALVEGRVDVTEIGRNQLLALMDILDPTGADALLNKARLGLSVGYPKFVGMQMQQGFLDLEVGLGGVLEQQFKISNLPLSPIINAKTQDLVKTIREVPIQ